MRGMYTPRAFAVDDDARLHGLMRDCPFAVLVSRNGAALDATHLPFMVDASRGPHGTLLAHMARANPHWKRFDGVQEATAIFTGPHAYVSPSWYADPHTVPTWNYAVVHAHGRPVIIDDPGRLRELLARLVDVHEAALEPAWTMDQAGPGLERQIDHIVAFEIELTRLEGKYKLNQNRSDADRRGAANALAESHDPRQRAVAALMRKTMDRGDGQGG